MPAHSAENGAFGYILNRPLEKNVSDLLNDSDLGPLAKLPVYLGGPVGTGLTRMAMPKTMSLLVALVW